MLENRPGQLLPISVNSKDSSSASSAATTVVVTVEQQQQQRILEKVWKNIEKAMGEMKNVLVAQLQDASRTVEEQEKTLE